MISINTQEDFFTDFNFKINPSQKKERTQGKPLKTPSLQRDSTYPGISER